MSFIKNLKIGQKVVLVLVVAILVAFTIAGIVISRMALKFSDESAMVQVKAVNGIVVGIVSDQKTVAETSNTLAKLRERIVSIRVGKTGHPFVVNAAPGPDFGKMVMHPDAKLEGVVVLDVPDAKGRKIFREMLEKKQGELEYRWAGDVSTSNNVLAYSVEPGSQWLVGTWANADEVGEGIRSVITVAMIIGLVLLVVLPLVIVLVVRRIVTKPLAELQQFCTEIERSHDFTIRPPMRSNDEVGQTTAAVERLATTLRSTFSQLLGNITRVDEATHALANAARNTAQNSSQASDAAAAMAASVEQLTVGISHITDNASEAASLSRESGARSQEGGKTILSATQEMNAIAAKVRDTSRAILALGEESRQISGIVSVIKEVAEQTNLLALNAAIEAARAGEAGRGFAVVADEVRKLAERTTHATSEIANVTGSIQQRAEQAVNVMTDAVQQVEQGAELANRAGSAIEDIRNGAERVVHVVTQITDSLSESSTASHSMSIQTERVARVAEESDHAAQSSVQAAGNLEQLTRQMREAVQRFRI